MWCWLGIGKDFKPVGLPTAVEKDDAHDFFWDPFFKLVEFLAAVVFDDLFSETHMVHHFRSAQCAPGLMSPCHPWIGTILFFGVRVC